jgi:predicted nucleic acid-binding protein
MSFVLDNSVALAWCFRGEQTPAIMALLDRVVAEGAVAPLLWPLEALNGLHVAQRRGRLDRVRRDRMAGFLRDLPIILDQDTAGQSWGPIAELADRLGLTLYDAAYLELAQRRRLPLASLDHDLRRAAQSTSVELLGIAEAAPPSTKPQMNTDEH